MEMKEQRKIKEQKEIAFGESSKGPRPEELRHYPQALSSTRTWELRSAMGNLYPCCPDCWGRGEGGQGRCPVCIVSLPNNQKREISSVGRVTHFIAWSQSSFLVMLLIPTGRAELMTTVHWLVTTDSCYQGNFQRMTSAEFRLTRI